jgi:hypothetical protein
MIVKPLNQTPLKGVAETTSEQATEAQRVAYPRRRPLPFPPSSPLHPTAARGTCATQRLPAEWCRLGLSGTCRTPSPSFGAASPSASSSPCHLNGWSLNRLRCRGARISPTMGWRLAVARGKPDLSRMLGSTGPARRSRPTLHSAAATFCPWSRNGKAQPELHVIVVVFRSPQPIPSVTT